MMGDLVGVTEVDGASLLVAVVEVVVVVVAAGCMTTPFRGDSVGIAEVGDASLSAAVEVVVVVVAGCVSTGLRVGFLDGLTLGLGVVGERVGS